MGTVYIMARAGTEELKIGHHSTTDEQREREVRYGFGEEWQILHSVPVGSKLKANAVEGFVHAKLADSATNREPTRHANGLRGPKSIQVYNCALDKANAAMHAAVEALESYLK